MVKDGHRLPANIHQPSANPTYQEFLKAWYDSLFHLRMDEFMMAIDQKQRRIGNRMEVWCGNTRS